MHTHAMYIHTYASYCVHTCALAYNVCALVHTGAGTLQQLLKKCQSVTGVLLNTQTFGKEIYTSHTVR